MSEDTLFLWQSVAVGIGITFLYDWLRILRRVIPHRQWAVSLEDLVFWLVCTVAVFWWMYRVTNGGMRWFAVAGALTGMCLYRRLLSEFLVTYVSKLLQCILQILVKGLRILLQPLCAVGRSLAKKGSSFSRKRRKITGNLKIWLKNWFKVLKIRLRKR